MKNKTVMPKSIPAYSGTMRFLTILYLLDIAPRKDFIEMLNSMQRRFFDGQCSE